jgi:hypothetical protein
MDYRCPREAVEKTSLNGGRVVEGLGQDSRLSLTADPSHRGETNDWLYTVEGAHGGRGSKK